MIFSCHPERKDYDTPMQTPRTRSLITLGCTLLISTAFLSSCDFFGKEKNTKPKPPPAQAQEKITFQKQETKTPDTAQNALPQESPRVRECETNDLALDQHFPDADIIAVLAYADWCPHSQEFSPILESFTKQNEPKLRVLRLNADALPDLAKQLGVNAIPKTIFFSKGKRIGEFVGSIREDKLGIILDNLNRDISRPASPSPADTPANTPSSTAPSTPLTPAPTLTPESAPTPARSPASLS